jgi:acid stress chaperone HdeB
LTVSARDCSLESALNFIEHNQLRSNIKMKPKVALAALALACFTVSTAQAQVLVDVSKITCEQFILWKITDPDKIALWLSGYYNGKRGNTIIDTKSLEENENKVKDYCRANNLKPTVMQAVEALIATNK